MVLDRILGNAQFDGDLLSGAVFAYQLEMLDLPFGENWTVRAYAGAAGGGGGQMREKLPSGHITVVSQEQQVQNRRRHRAILDKKAGISVRVGNQDRLALHVFGGERVFGSGDETDAVFGLSGWRTARAPAGG